VKSVSLTPDGKTAVTGGTDGTLRLWDLATARERRVLEGPPAAVMSYTAALSPDGKVLASACGRTVQLWDVASGKVLHQMGDAPNSTAWFTPLAFAPDGKTLASAGSPTVSLWEVPSGKLLRQIPGGWGASDSLAFAPDGQTLAVGCADGCVRLCDPGTGRVVRQITGHSRVVSSVAFTPDGKTLASWCGGDRTARLWETATGQERRQFFVGILGRGLIGYSCVAVSPDGKLLAAGAQDRSVRVWEAATGKQLARLEGHEGWVRALAFTPDGKSLISGGDDTTALVWDVEDLGKKAVGLRGPHGRGDLEGFWDDLRGDDAVRAYRAVCTLAGTPGAGVPFLRDKLGKSPAVDARRLARLIKDLDDDLFEVREKATGELAALGVLAEPALRQALRDDPSPEVNSRARRLLGAIKDPGRSSEPLRERRVVEVLEQAATSEARQLLDTLARRAGAGPEAKAALGRLARRPAAP
jgi:sugar lactone lactonase YvrE